MPTTRPEDDPLSRIFGREHIVWNRETEGIFVNSLVAALAMRRTPRSAREADVYRFSAQLLKTSYPIAAEFLDAASLQFHRQAHTAPRLFPELVKEGLIGDVPRLRHLLEKRMSGVSSW
ncbi:hypothetical protein [Massilia timonae]|uniref:hypothetical protein n=1 Tax=Massilia timonae TaxID=47229 RepID=UPI0028D27AF7|nr:hypothetical protein [Massilia timonae]